MPRRGRCLGAPRLIVPVCPRAFDRRIEQIPGVVEDARRHCRRPSACLQFPQDLLFMFGVESINQCGEVVMAKGQMRSNKEKKKPKADKNLKKGAALPNPFASSGKPPAGQSPNSKKS
jgi:hypothetical protein